LKILKNYNQIFKINKMKKLSLDALKERAEATASTELLATISGGLENACHVEPEKTFMKRLNDFLNW
jgi:hypothetical protein